MKKTFPLQVAGKHPERLLDAIKHDIRKYIKRERRRELPEGVDFWDFDCKFGLSQETADVVHLANLLICVDSAAKAQAPQCYVEILATHGVRSKRTINAMNATSETGAMGETREHQERHALTGAEADNND